LPNPVQSQSAPNNNQLKNLRKTKRGVTAFGITGFPAMLRAEPIAPYQEIEMKYSDIFTTTTNAAAALYGNQIDLKLNSIFAPVAGGHQPYGRDAYALLYNRYAVLGAQVKLRFGTNATSPILCTADLTLANGLAGMTGNGFSTIADQPNSRTEILNGVGSPQVTMEFGVDLPKLLGLTADEYVADTADYGSVMSASPAQSFFLSVAAAGMIAGGLTWSCMYEITYKVRFYDRVLQPQS
jgi:hypothetical protein